MSTHTPTANDAVKKASSGCPIHRMIEWQASESIISRVAIALYGLIAYLAFFGAILYAIGFVTGLLVPKDINDGAPGSIMSTIAINGCVLTLFVIQHTVMARPRFKSWVTRYIPHAMERSTFVLAASLIFGAMFWVWQPMPDVIWHIEQPIIAYSITGLSLIGWAIVFGSSFMVSHFDLFGLRQVFMNLRGRGYHQVAFRLTGFYMLVRHPLMTGFLIAFWFTPTMTLGHLFFAVMCTIYILFGTMIEERDLIASFGDRYLTYKREVPGLIPFTKLRTRNEVSS